MASLIRHSLTHRVVTDTRVARDLHERHRSEVVSSNARSRTAVTSGRVTQDFRFKYRYCVCVDEMMVAAVTVVRPYRREVAFSEPMFPR